MTQSERFGFESLDVYQRAIEFVALCSKILAGIPRGHAALADQLRRASISIPLNIAEGTGRTGTRDHGRHRAIARGSAMECAAILDVCGVLGIASDGLMRDGRGLLLGIVQMLTKMCR